MNIQQFLTIMQQIIFFFFLKICSKEFLLLVFNYLPLSLLIKQIVPFSVTDETLHSIILLFCFGFVFVSLIIYVLLWWFMHGTSHFFQLSLVLEINLFQCKSVFIPQPRPDFVFVDYTDSLALVFICFEQYVPLYKTNRFMQTSTLLTFYMLLVLIQTKL